MTYNRMEAKPIKGEHCRFCGDAKAALVKTPCCEQWICCLLSRTFFRSIDAICLSMEERHHATP